MRDALTAAAAALAAVTVAVRIVSRDACAPGQIQPCSGRARTVAKCLDWLADVFSVTAVRFRIYYTSPHRPILIETTVIYFTPELFSL
jgi:hypothetical protein